MFSGKKYSLFVICGISQESGKYYAGYLLTGPCICLSCYVLPRLYFLCNCHIQFEIIPSYLAAREQCHIIVSALILIDLPYVLDTYENIPTLT